MTDLPITSRTTTYAAAQSCSAHLQAAGQKIEVDGDGILAKSKKTNVSFTIGGDVMSNSDTALVAQEATSPISLCMGSGPAASIQNMAQGSLPRRDQQPGLRR